MSSRCFHNIEGGSEGGCRDCIAARVEWDPEWAAEAAAKKAWDEGHAAALRGVALSENPYRFPSSPEDSTNTRQVKGS